MRLRKIAVEGFRALRQIEIAPADYTVLVGENAAGKSSLVHALRLLFDVEARELVSQLTEDDINHDALRAGSREFTVKVEVGALERHPELRAAFDRSIAKDGTEQYVTVLGAYRVDPSDPQGELEWSVFVMPPPGSQADMIPFTSRMARLIPLYFLSAVRDAARETRPTGRGLLGRLLDDLSLDDVATQLKTAVAGVNSQLLASAGLSQLGNDLTQLIEPLLVGGTGQLRFALAAEDIASIVKALRLLLQTGTVPMDFARHATGTQNLVLVGLFRHLVQRAVGVFPILVCEEPESHLHPSAQRRLARDLAALPGPTIVTTHSPVIVERTLPTSIVRLSGRMSGVSAHQWKSVGVQERTDFAQFIRSGRSDAVFARAIVLVEGESEAIALPAFAKQLGLDLDRDGVCIVRADSNAFGCLLRALGVDALNIPVVVTYDTDALSHDKKLLQAAEAAGLLTPVAIAVVGGTSEERKALLDGIGWLGAVENFEGEVCAAGYGPTALAAIASSGRAQSFETFLQTNGLARDGTGAAKYIVSDAGKRLKVSLARAVADAVPTVQQVPACYKLALETAIRMATT